MRVFRHSVMVFFLLLLLSDRTDAQPARPEDRIKGWSSDIDTLLYLMKREHYVYSKKPLPEKLLAEAVSLKTKVGQFSDERMLLELERLMFYMHDGHSYILPVAARVQAFYLPLQFYLFSDGVYIIDAEEPFKDLIGDRVSGIQGVAIETLVNDMNSYIHQDNKFTVKWFAPSVLRFRGLYEPYGLAPGSEDISMNLLNHDGKQVVRKISFIPARDFHGIPKLFPSRTAVGVTAPIYLAHVEDNYWFTRLPEKNAIYFQFNQVLDKENESLGSFGKRLDSILQAERPALLIIDVRHNNGGNLDLLQPLIDGIKKFEKSTAKARIIVITGRNTFSAAQVFISLLAKETHALFAGEPSSSSPNFVGEGNYISLPWSGAMGSISNKYHESIPGDMRKWIEPDFPVSLSSKDYFNNQDPVLNFILKR